MRIGLAYLLLMFTKGHSNHPEGSPPPRRMGFSQVC